MRLRLILAVFWRLRAGVGAFFGFGSAGGSAGAAA